MYSLFYFPNSPTLGVSLVPLGGIYAFYMYTLVGATMRILGIDCSSTTIGYCTLDLNSENNIKYVSSGYIKPIKNFNIVEKLVDTRNNIKNIIENSQPDIIVIEDIVKFMKGRSSANTIITLTSFNRMVCLVAYDILGKSPLLLNVMTIRHGIKKDSNLENLPSKEELPEIVAKKLNINFPWVYNKKEVIKIESYDVSDAICCAYVQALKIKEELNPSSKKKKKTKI